MCETWRGKFSRAANIRHIESRHSELFASEDAIAQNYLASSDASEFARTSPRMQSHASWRGVPAPIATNRSVMPLRFHGFGTAKPTSAALGHNRRRCIDFSFVQSLLQPPRALPLQRLRPDDPFFWPFPTTRTANWFHPLLGRRVLDIVFTDANQSMNDGRR